MKTGRVVVVTGAASGMGRLVVERFLAEGDDVVATDVERDALKALSEAQAPGARLRTIAVDTSLTAYCAIVAALTREMHGHVDVLVNVAGSFPVRPFDARTTEDFRRVVDVDLTSVFLAIKAMAPLRRSRGRCRTVTVGSTSIYEGGADQVHDAAARAGLVGLSRGLAHVLGRDGITINVMTPGLTHTPRTRAGLLSDLAGRQIALRAIPRTETGEDVIGAIAVLASRGADFITGRTVDGGNIDL